MGALHVFMLGAVCYGFVAVLDWVFLMCAEVRHAAYCPIPGNNCLRRQASSRIDFSNPSQKEKGLDETLPFSSTKEKIGAAAHPEILQGVISGETVRQISGDMLGKWEVTSRSWPLGGRETLDAGRAQQDRLPRQKLSGPRR